MESSNILSGFSNTWNNTKFTNLSRRPNPLGLSLMTNQNMYMIAITLVLLLLGLLIFLTRSKTSSLEPSKQPPRYRGRFGESETTATIELRKKIEGTWRLVSYHIKAYGPITMQRYPLGVDASGYIMYTSSGYMSVQIMAGNRPQSKAINPHACTKSENTEAGSHYMAYCGTYSVGFGSEDQLLVKHSVEQSLFSNWIDSDQIRIAELTNDKLTLTTAELPTHYGMEVEAVLKWKRVD